MEGRSFLTRIARQRCLNTASTKYGNPLSFPGGRGNWSPFNEKYIVMITRTIYFLALPESQSLTA